MSELRYAANRRCPRHKRTEQRDAASKEMIWHNGDEQYYPGGVTDPNYCVLKFTATDGRFYSDFYPRSFVIE